MQFINSFLAQVSLLERKLDTAEILTAIELLAQVRARSGRLFILGLGGSAGNASHAVNDFRKLCGFEAYCPSDNVSELTARANDEGFETIYSGWLNGSNLCDRDCILVLSVGGGKTGVSQPLICALDYAQSVKASIIGIVGRDGGATKEKASVCILVPTINESLVTPLVESFQAIIWHLLVSHPSLKQNATKW